MVFIGWIKTKIRKTLKSHISELWILFDLFKAKEIRSIRVIKK